LNFCNNGETLRCPWRGFEFSLLDGRPTVPAAPQRPMMLRFYDVEVDGDDIVVTT
jgi:nitrite reductase/ring-hydroxylating ferredoxin subunit